MPDDSIALLPAHEIARRVRAREISPVEVLDACMARVDALNPRLNAVVTLNPRARDEAEALGRRIAAGEDAGPLAGVPVGIRDVTAVGVVRTTLGSALFSAPAGPATAGAVRFRRLRHLLRQRPPERPGAAVKLGRSIVGALCLVLSACAVPVPDTAGAPETEAATGAIAFIPRHRALSAADQQRVEGKDYDPVALPLAFTPDGDLVVGHRERYTISDLSWQVCAATGFYLVPRSGGPARPLVIGEGVCHIVRRATASANGAWVVYQPHSPPAGADFVRLELATGRADTIMTRSGVEFRSPALSPDGQMIAAVGSQRGSGVEERNSLYVTNSDGSDLRAIVEGNVSADSPPVWSEDGQRLAYARERSEVVVVGVDGTDSRVVGRGRLLAWSRDAEWLAILRRDGAIQVVRPDGTGRRVLVGGPMRPALPQPVPRTVRFPEWRAAFSPDSRWLAFSRMLDESISIWRVDAASRRLRQVTRPDN